MKRQRHFCKSVQKQDTSDAEIAYYLGIAEDGLGHLREAQASYEVAYRQAAFRARAAARIGELLARQGDLHQAQRFLKDAVSCGSAGRSYERSNWRR